jgi:hypothetical protein
VGYEVYVGCCATERTNDLFFVLLGLVLGYLVFGTEVPVLGYLEYKVYRILGRGQYGTEKLLADRWRRFDN